MQKALTQMNIQLANVISDLSGVTGQLIVRGAIPQGYSPGWSFCVAQLTQSMVVI
jgi:hypothetical protein